MQPRVLTMHGVLAALTCLPAYGQEVATVLEVQGPWLLVDNKSPVRQFQALRLKTKLRYTGTRDGPAGKLVLADLQGNKYWDTICEPFSRCEGDFVINTPPSAQSDSLLSRIYATVAHWITGDSGSNVSAITGSVTLGDNLKDGVAKQTGDLIAPCPLFGSLPIGEYRLEFRSLDDSQNVISPLTLDTSKCPSSIEAKGLAPGVYQIVARGAGRDETAYVLIAPCTTGDAAAERFETVSRESEAWYKDAPGAPEAINPSTRRRFLVGYLHVLAEEAAKSPCASR